MREVGVVVAGITLGAVEVVVVGVMLAIGFHLGAKIIERVEGQKKLTGRTKLAKARA